MHSERNIEQEMEQAALKAAQSDDPVWKDITDPSDFDDFDFYVHELQLEGKRGSISTFRSAETNVKEFGSQIDCDPTEFGIAQAKEFARWQKDRDITDWTAKLHMLELSKMARFFTTHDYYAGDPFEEAIDKTEWAPRQTSPGPFQSNRVQVEWEELREAILDTLGTETFLILMLLLKTAIRISEAVNLDLRDIHLDHPIAEEVMPPPREEIADEPDTIYIDRSVKTGTKGHGNNGNKRKISTQIPIDAELKAVLVWWIAVMPPTTDDSAPLLRYVAHPSHSRKLGSRLSSKSGSGYVIRWAQEHGFHDYDNDPMENVSAHWFRSYVTDTLVSRIREEEIDGHSPRAFVKGLRGDASDEAIDVYIQGGDYVRPAVVNNTPKLGLK